MYTQDTIDAYFLKHAGQCVWGHLAVMKLVANPKATGTLCSTMATAIVRPSELLSDLLAAPTAKPSALNTKSMVSKSYG